jgi:hypothetical protein
MMTLFCYRLYKGIYIYIHEATHVSRACSVADLLYLQFMTCNVMLLPVLYILYLYSSIRRSMCAVPNMTVFCSSLISCFLGMLLRYFLNDFEIVAFAPVVTGITFVSTFYMRCISVVKSCIF